MPSNATALPAARADRDSTFLSTVATGDITINDVTATDDEVERQFTVVLDGTPAAEGTLHSCPQGNTLWGSTIGPLALPNGRPWRSPVYATTDTDPTVVPQVQAAVAAILTA